MKGRILVLYDTDSRYALRLQQFFNNSMKNPFEIHVFTEKEKLEEGLECLSAEVLLVAETAFYEELRDSSAAYIFILNESGLKNYGDLPNINKYQSAENVLSDIVSYYTDYAKELLPQLINTKVSQIIGVYSPVNRCLQTSFSIALCSVLAEKGKVLYINFENFSGFSQMFHKGYGKDLSDLIYYFGCNRERFIYRLESIVETFRNFDFIPPSMTPVSLSAIEQEMWIQMLQVICIESSYDYIVLDLSCAIQGLFEILGYCNRIYTIEKDDPMSVAKLAQYEQVIQCEEYRDIAEHSRRCQLPYFKSLHSNFEQVIFKEMAEYVRTIVNEDFHDSGKV